MPGANYMGGRRNAAKARVKDTTGRLERMFFGQRRLSALSNGRSISKPSQGYNIPPGESSGLANISFGHARQKTPPNNDISKSSFVPSPIHISPCTPRSRRRTRKRLESQSSSSNISKSAVLDALDISEPMFLRGVLDKILSMPDLAGISGSRVKPAVATGSQPLACDESSLLQRTKRKRSSSDFDEGTDSPSNERTSSSSKYMQPYVYERICTPLKKNYTSSGHKVAGKGRTGTDKILPVEDDIFPHWENTSSYSRGGYNMELSGGGIHDSGSSNVTNGDDRSSPLSRRDFRSSPNSTFLKDPSSNHTPFSNINARQLKTWNEGQTGLPSSIIFRGLKNGSAKRSMGMATYPVQEPTIYGTLFEQADPWDAIGQILGLSDTKLSKAVDSLSEINEGETSMWTHSMVVNTEEEEHGEESMSRLDSGHDETIKGQVKRGRTSSRSDSLNEYDRTEEGSGGVTTALSKGHQPFDNAEQISQEAEDQDRLSADKEKQLFSFAPIPQDILEALESPDRTTTGTVELDSLECSELVSTEEAICNKKSESILVVPELQYLDGLFMGPSLFEGLDESEDE